jgi:hypothetical protein
MVRGFGTFVTELEVEEGCLLVLRASSWPVLYFLIPFYNQASGKEGVRRNGPFVPLGRWSFDL